MIMQSIVRGAKGFAKEFRRELHARQIARGTLALQRRAKELDSMSPAQQTEYNQDVAAILKRSSEIVRSKNKPQ